MTIATFFQIVLKLKMTSWCKAAEENLANMRSRTEDCEQRWFLRSPLNSESSNSISELKIVEPETVSEYGHIEVGLMRK